MNNRHNVYNPIKKSKDRMVFTILNSILLFSLYIINYVNSQCIANDASTATNNCGSYTYNYTDGGDNWIKTWKICEARYIQSPIGITDYNGLCDGTLTFYAKYIDNPAAQSVNLMTDMNNNTFYFSYPDINYYLTDLNGEFQHYTSEYIYFRNPAEHTLNRKEYEVEMQVQAKLASGYVAQNATRLYVSYMFINHDTYNNKAIGTTADSSYNDLNTFLDGVNLSYNIYKDTVTSATVSSTSIVGYFFSNFEIKKSFAFK